MNLSVENLSFGYGARTVLHEVSFTAQTGELLAILGPNGVGKTTLFKCILGLTRRYTGTIRADDGDLAALSPRERAHRVAAIPQAHPLSFRYRVFDMVLMGTSHTLSPLAVPGEELTADLAETDPAFPAFLEECLENFTCHEYGHLSSMDQVENFLSRDLRKENTWMQGNYPSENWGEVHLEIFYDQGLFHRLEKAPRDLALAQQKKEREAAQ